MELSHFGLELGTCSCNNEVAALQSDLILF